MTHRDRKIDGGTTSCESGVQSGEEVGFEEDGLEFRGREEGEDGVNEDRRGEDVHLMEEPINEGNVRGARGKEGQRGERTNQEEIDHHLLPLSTSASS